MTALLNGLTADYDVFLYNAAGTELAKSVHGGTTADQASWTDTGSAAVNVYIRVNRCDHEGDLSIENQLLT